jgi:signal peptidase I
MKMTKQELTRAVTEMIREQLLLHRQATLQVISRSMSPVIQVGENIVVMATSFETVAPGDIVLFDCETTYCTHRLVTKYQIGERQFVVTRGDRIRGFDRPFEAERLLGKVVVIQTHRRQIDLNRPEWQKYHLIFGKFLRWQWHYLRKKSRNRLMRALFRRIFNLLNQTIVKLLRFRGQLTQ